VVEAEDERSPSSCLPNGPSNGGTISRFCLPPVTDVADDAFPEGVFTTLFASHVGQSVTLEWAGARPLVGDEHFHLLKAVDSPTASFASVTPEGDLSRSYTETDSSSPLQFFDLRVANACEALSRDEYPPGRTLP
jgi:hypothetical protein